MEKSQGESTATREEDGVGGGGGTGGGSKAGNKSDDDEDFAGAILGGTTRHSDRPLRMRAADLNYSGLRLLLGQLHVRDTEASVDVDPGYVHSLTSISSSTRLTSISIGSSNQQILSSTPPPSPSETGIPSLSSDSLSVVADASTLASFPLETSLPSTLGTSLLGGSPAAIVSSLLGGPSTATSQTSGSSMATSQTSESSTATSQASGAATATVPSQSSLSMISVLPLFSGSSTATTVTPPPVESAPISDGLSTTIRSSRSSTRTSITPTSISPFNTRSTIPANNSISSGRTSSNSSITRGPSPTVIFSPTNFNSTTSRSTTSSFSASNSTTRTSTRSSSTRTSSSTVLFTTSDSFFVGGGGGGGGGISSGSTGVTPTNTSIVIPTAENSGPNPRLVGGIVAGLAAFAMVLVALLLLLRRHKRNAIIHHRNELGYGGPASGASEGISSQQEPSSNPFSAVFGLFAAGRNRHQRNPSAASDERGFYRVSGRKLEPVLGGPRPRGSSVSAPPYSEDGGSLAKEIGTSISTISGAGPSRLSSPTPTPMGPVGLQPPVRDVIPEDQEYDATYKETGGGVRELSTPTPTPSMLMPVSSPSPLGGRPAIGGGAGRDGLGRSLPSLDGSRASKFTEDIL